jgi:phage terminase large subunit-like protein
MGFLAENTMNQDESTIALTRKELSNILEYTYNLIDFLPDEALSELLEGDDKNVDNLVDDIMKAIHEVFHYNNHTIRNFGGLEHFEKSFDDGLKILSYNYFKTTMLPNFEQGWRNLEWGNLIQLFPWAAFLAARGHGKSFEFCFAAPLWRMWRYRRPGFLQKDTIDNKNSKETVIITNESKLARKHMEKVNEEIRMNDLLSSVMIPDKMTDLGKDKIISRSGSSLEFRTYQGFIRGLHVGCVFVDDFLDESCLYSEDQRLKFHEIFYGAIKSIVEPYGYLIVSGTPFHEEDLYAKLKTDPIFKVFEYPAIMPDGTLLAPDRFNYKLLMDLKKSLGSIVFTREYLVKPVSDSSSLFPWEFLNKSFIGMENISLVDNIESFPIKMKRVVMGCDFAISGKIGADYSVFSVWGIDNDNNYYLLHVWRKQGASHREQVDVIVRLNQMFKCNKIKAENNGFQRIIAELVKERGVRNIEPFETTAKVKKNSYEGLPSLSAMFERGEIKIPYKDGKTRETALWLCGEFNSITFLEDTGKLESAGGTDDGAMSTFFAITELREKKSGFRVHHI